MRALRTNGTPSASARPRPHRARRQRPRPSGRISSSRLAPTTPTPMARRMVVADVAVAGLEVGRDRQVHRGGDPLDRGRASGRAGCSRRPRSRGPRRSSGWPWRAPGAGQRRRRPGADDVPDVDEHEQLARVVQRLRACWARSTRTWPEHRRLRRSPPAPGSARRPASRSPTAGSPRPPASCCAASTPINASTMPPAIISAAPR